MYYDIIMYSLSTLSLGYIWYVIMIWSFIDAIMSMYALYCTLHVLYDYLLYHDNIIITNAL